MIVSLNSAREKFDSNLDGLGYRNNPERSLPIRDRTELVEDGKPSIRYATLAYRNALIEFQRDGVIDLSFFPVDFDVRLRYRDYVLPEEAKVQIEKLTHSEKTEIAYRVIDAIHNGWLSDYQADFFLMYVDWEFLFLPTELIGIEFFKAYLDLTRELFGRFQIEVTDNDLIGLFFQKRKEFLRRKNVHNFQGLVEAVVDVGHDYCNFGIAPKIAKALQNRGLAFDVARQVLYHSPDLFRRCG